MLWILVVVGIFAGLVYLVLTVTELFSLNRDWDDVLSYAIRLGISIVVTVIGFLGFAGIASFDYEEVLETNNGELISFIDNSEISGETNGSLFYIHAFIGRDEVYSFYWQVGDEGGFKRKKVNAEDATIHETNDCIPHVVEYTTYTRNKLPDFLRVILTFWCGELTQKEYKVYLPTGTILRTFELDMQ